MKHPEPNPELSIVLLSWNQRALTQRCVDSIRSATDVSYQLVIVDNGSTDGSAQLARDEADVAITNSENLGFSAGMNQGLELATGRHVAFLNNDTVLPEQWASLLIETYGQLDRGGIVLPAVTAAGNQFAVRERAGDRQITVPAFRHLPSGVLYLSDTAIMNALGGWDERYRPAGREDLDLLFTVWIHDLSVVLDERVLVRHESSATVDTQLPDKAEIWRVNRDRFVTKWRDDPPRRPLLDDVDSGTFARNLEVAATVVTWMQQRFDVDDRLAEVARQRNELRERLSSGAHHRSMKAKMRDLAPAWVLNSYRRIKSR
jgi:GT2 family glycosyltransferase